MTQNSPAALLIFVITIAISLYGLYGNGNIINKMLLHPYSVKHKNEWYKIITSGFVHADLGHLMFNMLSFFFFAFQTEANFLGSVNFLIVYFGSMIIADLPTVWKNQDNYNYHSLGASGAISGILFSSILFAPLSKVYIMFIPFGMPAFVFGILYLLYCQFGTRYSQDNINHSAHFWGALAGIIITILLEPNVIGHFLRFFY
jgi:membrane associated rhomboid family serine protease